VVAGIVPVVDRLFIILLTYHCSDGRDTVTVVRQQAI